MASKIKKLASGSSTSSISRRSLLKTGAVSAGFLAMPGIVRRAYAARELNIAFTNGHENAARTAFIDDFAEETGVTINYIVRRTSPVTEVKMQVDTQSYQWDIVGTIARDIYLQIVDHVEPIDYDAIPELGALPEDAKAPGYAPYELSAAVMAYDVDTFPDKAVTWEGILDTTNFPGGRTMRQRGKECAEIALRMSGVDPKDNKRMLESAEGWELIYAKLDEMRPLVNIWWTEEMPAQEIVNKEIVIAPAPLGDFARLNAQGANLVVNWDRGFYKHHGFVIPKGAPNADVAKEFLAFALKPERIAKYTEIMAGPGPIIPGAIELVDPTIAKTMPTYAENFAQMAPEVVEYWVRNASEVTTRFNEWILKG